MYKAVITARLLENKASVSSGSNLLDSFNRPMETTIYLQDEIVVGNESVVDVETILEELARKKKPYKLLEQSFETPRGKAVRRLASSLEADRAQCRRS